MTEADWPVPGRKGKNSVFGARDKEILIRSEVEDRILSISLEEKVFIARHARIQAAKTRGQWTAKELIQEAYTRALGGDRKWQRGYSAAMFFAGPYGVIRSIASSANPRADADKKISPEYIGANLSDPEGDAQTRATFEVIIGALNNDPILCGVLLGMAGLASKTELMKKFKLDDTRYETIRKTIRRVIEKLKQDGRI